MEQRKDHPAANHRQRLASLPRGELPGPRPVDLPPIHAQLRALIKIQDAMEPDLPYGKKPRIPPLLLHKKVILDLRQRAVTRPLPPTDELAHDSAELCESGVGDTQAWGDSGAG